MSSFSPKVTNVQVAKTRGVKLNMAKLLGEDLAPQSASKAVKDKKKKTASDNVSEEIIVPTKQQAQNLPNNFANLQNTSKNNAETSVILPVSFPQELLPELRKQWKEMCSGQVFNGDLLERDFLQFVNNAKGPYSIVDIDRYEAGTATSGSFLEIAKMKDPGRVMYFKGNFNLAKVNSFTDKFATVVKPARGKTAETIMDVSWAQIKTLTKGKDNVEPDVLVWEWDGTSRPIIHVIEMKAGFGEAQASDSTCKEYIQLCRTKKLFEYWLGQLEQLLQLPNTNQKLKNKLRANRWMKPDVQLWFVAFAATSPSQVNLGVPGRVWRLTEPSKYKVTPLTGYDFGNRFGISVPFIRDAVSEVNSLRQDTLNTTIQKFTQPPPIGNARLYKMYVNAQSKRARNMRAATRSTVFRPANFLGNTGSEVVSFTGASNVLAGRERALKPRATKRKLNVAAAERSKTMKGPQENRKRRAVAVAQELLSSYSKGNINVSTGELTNAAERRVRNLAQNNAKLLEAALKRAQEIDPNMLRNSREANRFKNELMRNVLNEGLPLFSE